MMSFHVSPRVMFRSLWVHRALIVALAWRDVAGRYQGSLFGILWSFFNPLLMLAVYAFVFSVIFTARWDAGNPSRAEFALILYAGLLVFNLFAECVNRAPSLILSHVSYVKKVVFPLEVLPCVAFCAALFHATVNLIVWLIFSLFVLGAPPVSAILFPLLLVPLTFLTMGFSWFLASLGVFLRDVSQVVGIMTTALLFLTPIFYPASALPERYHWAVRINPLAFIVEQTQSLLVFGRGLDWHSYLLVCLISTFTAFMGFAWFQKTRKGFADVI